MVREEHRGLAGRVAAADDQHGVAGAALRLDHRRGVVDAGALEALEVGHVELAVAGARGDDHRPAVDDLAALECDREVVRLAAQLQRSRRDDQARAKAPRLELRPLRQLAAGDAGGEAEVVLDPRRGAGLPAERDGVDRLGVEPFRGTVERGGQARRAAAHDHEVAHRGCGSARAEAEHRRDLRVGGVAQHHVAVDQHRGLGRRDAQRLQRRARLRVLVELDPLVRHAVAGEELAQPPRVARVA